MRFLFSKRFYFSCEISSLLSNTFTNKNPSSTPRPPSSTTKVKWSKHVILWNGFPEKHQRSPRLKGKLGTFSFQMSYSKVAEERRSRSSDEFEVEDKAVSFHAPILLDEMANRNFEGPPHATSGSSKTATQIISRKFANGEKIICLYGFYIECALQS